MSRQTRNRADRSRNLWRILGLLVAVLSTACSSGEDLLRKGAGPAASENKGVWPTEGWPLSTPEREGIDPTALAAVDALIRAGDYGFVDSFLLIRNGRLVADYRYVHDYVAASADRNLDPNPYNYFHPDWHPFYKGGDVHTMQSVTKSWTSALVGVAIGRGEIESVEVPGLSFFQDRDFPDQDGRKATMSLADLLTMRAGFEWNEASVPYSDPGNDCARLEAEEDWLQYVLEKPLSSDPGSVFVYNSGVSVLLSGILLEATGVTIDRYAEEHLFGPLGIFDYHWKKTPLGLPDTEGGLYLRAEDLAKLGYLFLKEGVWEGKQILPEGWVAASIQPWVADTEPDNGQADTGYGYQWWILDDGNEGDPVVYGAVGFGGQYLLVVPELELITVFTGWNIFGDPPRSVELFRDFILPAVDAA